MEDERGRKMIQRLNSNTHILTQNQEFKLNTSVYLKLRISDVLLQNLDLKFACLSLNEPMEAL